MLRTVSLRVRGVVQGVGYRPFVRRLAIGLGLAGHVGNDSEGVFVRASGPSGAVDALIEGLVEGAPRLAVVEQVEVLADQRGPSAPAADVPSGFDIIASRPLPSTGPATSLPADTAVCAECLAEMRDPRDRRHGYPFIACTNCGPRFTIVTGLPHDRDRTTMVDFPLCPGCRREYEDPTSRRFHAQPTACPACGPELSLPVAEVAAMLRSGAIVAVKGVGGYHLACDAGDPRAVSRLRERKRRGAKPFAVMVPDLASARALVWLDAAGAELLASPARPIVLAESRHPELQRAVAPGTHVIGVMLAYAPLHHLLFDADAPGVLVMTSGNGAEEPICITAEEAQDRLGGIADAFCHHNRRIHVACDDSVVRVVAGGPQPVRRSRGYAPMPVALPLPAHPMLAVGGELKAAAAVADGRRVWLGQHIGDTENLETLAMLARSLRTLADLQMVRPELVVSDAHPGYRSHRWAADHARALGVEHLVVQHHHAHLASLMAEHGLAPGRPVLGVVFDGTGYGRDGTIWGGELLLGDYASVRRVGHLRRVLLPGGDAAIRHPARSAVAHLAAAGFELGRSGTKGGVAGRGGGAPGGGGRSGGGGMPGGGGRSGGGGTPGGGGRSGGGGMPGGGGRSAGADLTELTGLDVGGTAPAAAIGSAGMRLLGQMLATGSSCVPTSSVGRLFDAVASLLDVRHDIEYEAQAAIELEAAATQALVLDPGGGAGPGTSPSDAARSHPGSPAVGQDQPADPSRWPDAGWVEGRSKGDEESHGAESGGQGVLVLDPAPWIARAAADHAAGVPAGVAARAFHAALARSVLEAAERVRGSTSVSIVGLTGGVFANALLTEDCVKMLEPAGFTVLIHRKVPPNDGGLALGQVAVAAAGGARRRL